MVKRNHFPRKGLWTIPAGFMESGETPQSAAQREALEEAHAEVQIGSMLAMYCIPAIDQILMYFRGTLLNYTTVQVPMDEYGHLMETQAVDLFSLDNIPWHDLAFPANRMALQFYIENQFNENVQHYTFQEPVLD